MSLINRPTTCFYSLLFSLSSGFLCGGSADYYELTRYLKPSADSGGTPSNLGLHPDPNAVNGESPRAVVVAAANKEAVAVLSETTTIYYNTCFRCTNHEIITLETLLL